MLPKLITLLWVACSSLACNRVKKEQREARSPNNEVSYVDYRSDLQKEIYGVPLVGVISIMDMEMNSVVLVNSVEKEEICKNKDCKDGDLDTEVEYPQDVSFEALQVLLEENRIVLIDVRNRTELQEVGRIPGSVNVPLHEIPDAFYMEPELFKEKYEFDLPSKEDRNLVLTCRSGRRILVAEEKMKPLGYKYLRLYRGSFNDWKEKGGDIL